jgi:hypothetical protein
MNNASPGKSSTIGVSVGSKDGLLAAQPPVTGTVKVQAPALP